MAEEPSALDLANRLAEGSLTSSDLAETCLKRIGAQEKTVQAWAHLEPDYARRQAQALDKLKRMGRGIGALHGLPIGIKDIIDVRGLNCENGTLLDEGRRPTADAALIEALKSAGALIMGKTVTTELAYFSPGKTRNPHDPARTPGGSSSGSAAAVAAGMVPAAIGSQTNGSVIRPASFCGVVGFKPTRGLIPTKGVLRQSPSLDNIGTFARTIEDAALVTDIIASGDPAQHRPPAQLLKTCQIEPPLPPRFAFIKSPVWDQAEPDTRQGFAELMEALGDQAETIALPEAFAQGHAAHFKINMAELAKNYGHYARRGRSRLSTKMQEAIDAGNAISAPEYLAALDWIEVLNAGLEAVFENYDAILTPSAAGEAPADLTQTGSPAFCTLWTLCGTPAITLPLLQGENNMPIGVQLVSRRGDDARLLRTARWLTQYLSETSS